MVDGSEEGRSTFDREKDMDGTMCSDVRLSCRSTTVRPSKVDRLFAFGKSHQLELPTMGESGCFD